MTEVASPPVPIATASQDLASQSDGDVRWRLERLSSELGPALSSLPHLYSSLTSIRLSRATVKVLTSSVSLGGSLVRTMHLYGVTHMVCVVLEGAPSMNMVSFSIYISGEMGATLGGAHGLILALCLGVPRRVPRCEESTPAL